MLEVIEDVEAVEETATSTTDLDHLDDLDYLDYLDDLDPLLRTSRPTTNSTTAPTVAIPIERRFNVPWVMRPHPKNVPSHPPMKAPAMPRRIVMMQPEGSRPGTRNFASAPATRPRRIQ